MFITYVVIMASTTILIYMKYHNIKYTHFDFQNLGIFFQ